MLKFKKFFVCLVLALLLISSSVLATDTAVKPVMTVTSPKPENTTKPVVDTINEDLYIYNTDSYSLNSIIYGNIFASTNKFVTNPKNNGGIVYGNLYLISNEATIGSNVTYSNNKDKYGNYIIDSITSNSVINGNVYVLSGNFTVQAGAEIHGDLYVAADKVNIEQDAVIDGNIFITSTDITLNGQITGSAYITSKNFNMNSYAYITRDLYLNSKNATLSGIVYRNAFVTAYDKLLTNSDFRVNQNLSVDFAKDFTFSGEIQGDATINAENLKFKNDVDGTCIIRGKLNYATKTDAQIPDGVVAGEVTTSEYVDKTTNKFSFISLAFSLFTLLAYIFVVVFLSKLFAPKAVEKVSEFKLINVLISLGIGFASLFVVFLLFVGLALSVIGIPLAFFCVAGYLFLVGLALPLFINTIAGALKFKLHHYLKLLIVTVVFYLISLIPVFGSAVILVSVLIGIGQILFGLFKRNK